MLWDETQAQRGANEIVSLFYVHLNEYAQQSLIQPVAITTDNTVSHNRNQYLYFMADALHVLNNVRNCLLSQDIVLPKSVADSASLTSRTVTMHHVGTLVQRQAGPQLKFAPLLKQYQHLDQFANRGDPFYQQNSQLRSRPSL